MFGTMSEERVIHVPASEAWKLYGTLELPKLIQESMSSVVTKADIVEGDGGVGTVLEICMRTGPEEGAIIEYKEKFTVIDNEKRLKEVQMIEGGFLDFGFASHRVRFEVLEKEGHEEEQCVVKTTLEYEVKEEADAANNLLKFLLDSETWKKTKLKQFTELFIITYDHAFWKVTLDTCQVIV